MNNFGFFMALNSFERPFECPFKIMSAHIMSVQIRSAKVIHASSSSFDPLWSEQNFIINWYLYLWYNANGKLY